MKKERAILIRNPRLRRIRNELRILLKLWKSDITSKLNREISIRIRCGDKEEAIKLNKIITNLNLMERNSITTCPQCGFSNKDMVFIQHDGFLMDLCVQWICVDCNSKRLYFDRLREEVLTEMTMMNIEEVLE